MRPRGFPEGTARILVAIPAISFGDIEGSDCLKPFIFEPSPFSPTTRTLDVFSSELTDIQPKDMWGINVPHFPLQGVARGVAGPGMPSHELFVPPELEPEIERVCSKYDKWRPYPAQDPVSNYARKMATKFAKKRCSILRYAALKDSWDLIFYVDHSPASIAHLEKNTAIKVTELIISSVAKVVRDLPGVPAIVFSPYGTGEEDGFIVSNRTDGLKGDWNLIREILNGEWTP